MTIDKLFSDLPEYDPHPDLWNRIESDLISAERFEEVIGNMPQFEPETDLWDRITNELDGQAVPHPAIRHVEPVSGQRVRPLWAAAAVAATIVLVGVWINRQSVTTADERMEYTVEAGFSGAPVPTSTDLDADQRAEEFIRQQCAAQTLACQQPEVHELRNQLTELGIEQQRLEQERQTFGDDPILIRAQVKVENQRAEVTKELITLLRS
jgi:hypothetical protein